jgi:hypothetical protein
MPTTLKIEASAYKNGPMLSEDHVNFPVNLQEAVAKFGDDAVFAGFVKSYVIAAQAKIRAEYKAPSSSTRTKRGSALSQIENARRENEMKTVSNLAAENVQ